MARQFNVSREAVLRRLLTFGRTTDAFYRQKRGQYIADLVASQQRKKEKAADTEMRRNMPQETVRNFGKPLVNMLLDNYHQDRMTLRGQEGQLRPRIMADHRGINRDIRQTLRPIGTTARRSCRAAAGRAVLSNDARQREQAGIGLP